MERQFFSGNTIEQAILAAARHYGVDPDRVAYKLRDKKHGFLNVRRRIVIEVDPAAPERADSPPEAAHSPESASADARRETESPAGSEGGRPAGTVTGEGDVAERAEPGGHGGGVARSDSRARIFEAGRPAADTRGGNRGENDRRQVRGDGDTGDGVWHHRKAVSDEFTEEKEGEEDEEILAFEKALDEVLELMDLELEWSVGRQEEGFEIELEGEDEDLLVEDDGQLLRSIEHLLPRLVRGLLGYGLPCKVDCNDFHTSRDLELKELAGGMAELARRQGKGQILQPMNPADRRTVHLALADDPSVRTESEGDGYMKRVRILPEGDVEAGSSDMET